jgi:hypothetical protein
MRPPLKSSKTLQGKDLAQEFPVDSPILPTDPRLAGVVNAWPELPEAIRAGILAMVKAAKR